MAACISNNFFIFVIIAKNYWKVKGSREFLTVKAKIFECVIELWIDGKE